MPSSNSAAVPSFIHLDTGDPPSTQTLQAFTPTTGSVQRKKLPQKTLATATTTNHSPTSDSIVSAGPSSTNSSDDPTMGKITLFLKQFTLSRNHPHDIHHKRRGRPTTSRIRGKHGRVKATSPYLGHCRLASRGGTHAVSGGHSHYSDSLNVMNSDTRVILLRDYMQSRRHRLRQRLKRQQETRLLDTSDMSLDEDEVHDENDDSGNDADVFVLDPEQYRQSMWELEQRLWEKTESATKSRSHFLMERRQCAGERVDHVQRVVQRQRTEQEMRQHRVRDELEQKMMAAMARRKAYLEAAIENDPSRRFRRKSASVTVVSDNKTKAKGGAAGTGKGSTTKTAGLRQMRACSVTAATTPNMGKPVTTPVARTPTVSQDGHGQGQSLAKNSSGGVEMTTATKAHLTNMTSRTISTSMDTYTNTDTSLTARVSDEDDGKDCCKKGDSLEISNNNNTNNVDDAAGLEKMTLSSQWKIHQQLVQKASREYLKAIGGSHKRVLELEFNELARLLHPNKNLIQATLKLLKYSSQLVQMDMLPSQRPKRTYKNPARVFLSMYMVLAHPNQIRSPSESAADAPGSLDDQAFDSLLDSSKNLLEALQEWIEANSLEQSDIPNEEQQQGPSTASDQNTTAKEANSNRPRYAMLAQKFDMAWARYYEFFEAWKSKDAQRLLRTLLEHARQLESLWQSVRTDAAARSQWEPRIEERRRDLREKAGKLAGPEGVSQLDTVFGEFVNSTSTVAAPAETAEATATISTSTSTTTEAEAGAGTALAPPTIAAAPVTSEVLPGAKKRQRNASISRTNSANTSANEVNPSPTISHSNDAAANEENSSTTSPPQTKKPARSKASPSTAARKESSASNPVLEIPAGFENLEGWTNLQIVHELALDPNFKIEHKQPSTNHEGGGEQTLEARIRAMANKAYFDRIREDAEQGQLGQWIPPMLTRIREQLLDMVQPESAMANQIAEAFDLEFVQQQVDRKVYDIKAAFEGVLQFMSKLCAPVRDATIRQIQQDLQQVSGNPFQQDSTSSEKRAASSATSAVPKDLVSVLKDILELLDAMLMDLANFRLMVARPSLEQQAIPYEQESFKDSLANKRTSLEATTAWLQGTAVSHLRSSVLSASVPSTRSATTTKAAATSPTVTSNRHFEIFVNAVLDLLFSKKPLETLGKREFPETFSLDQLRMVRYQNEIQALALVAVMMNIALNVQPPLKDKEQAELKQELLKLMESAGTTIDNLTEAIIEFKEKALLMSAKSSSSSPTASPTSLRSPSPQPQGPPTALLLSEDQKSYLHNTIERAISFDSTLYNVITQRIRKVLESFLLSTAPGGKSGVMPDQAALNKVGLGAMATELEKLAIQIRFLTKYNARVYQQWYDPILTKILTSTVPPPASASASAFLNSSDMSSTNTGSDGNCSSSTNN
ncbi:hypothetical protein BGZ50_001338 [Haplosporangium sp. Z 11]|nr:hypothetical protein BGZ50_001338 [Haplosporangium sp. Z 11]